MHYQTSCCLHRTIFRSRARPTRLNPRHHSPHMMADDHNATATCSASDITVYSTSTNGYWSPTEKFDDLDSRIYCFARTEYDKNSMPMITFGFSSVNLSSTRRSKVTPHQFTISVTFKDLHHCVLLYESKQLMVTARSLTFLQKPSYIGNTFPPFRDSVINIIGDEKAMYGKVVFQANVEDTKFLSHVRSFCQDNGTPCANDTWINVPGNKRHCIAVCPGISCLRRFKIEYRANEVLGCGNNYETMEDMLAHFDQSADCILQCECNSPNIKETLNLHFNGHLLHRQKCSFCHNHWSFLDLQEHLRLNDHCQRGLQNQSRNNSRQTTSLRSMIYSNQSQKVSHAENESRSDTPSQFGAESPSIAQGSRSPKKATSSQNDLMASATFPKSSKLKKTLNKPKSSGSNGVTRSKSEVISAPTSKSAEIPKSKSINASYNSDNTGKLAKKPRAREASLNFPQTPVGKSYSLRNKVRKQPSENVREVMALSSSSPPESAKETAIHLIAGKPPRMRRHSLTQSKSPMSVDSLGSNTDYTDESGYFSVSSSARYSPGITGRQPQPSRVLAPSKGTTSAFSASSTDLEDTSKELCYTERPSGVRGYIPPRGTTARRSRPFRRSRRPELS